MVAVAYIGLGSNLAEPQGQLARALAELDRLPGSQCIAVSSLYATAPIGCRDPQPDYVNAVVALRTGLAPRRLLHALQAIERRHYRRRGARNAPRTLDLDLLLYGGLRCRHRRLVLPHPRLQQRAFVLRPLLEIATAARIPGLGWARRQRLRWLGPAAAQS